MNNNELISVVMPVHNAGAHLASAVHSIMQQTHRNLELIIVDDHSTDNAIGKLSLYDDRVKIFSSPQRGVVYAMNYGVEQASGEYLARMDADDVALPQRLKVQLEYLVKHPATGIVAAQVEIFSDQQLGEGYQLYQDWLNSVCSPGQIQCELYVESPLPNPTVMFRREIYKQLDGYYDSEWAEDYDCWLRADNLGIQMAKPEGILLRWRDHDQRLTRNDNRYSLHNFRKAKAHYLAQSHLKNKQVVIWGTGPIGVQFHDLLQQEKVSIKGFIDIHPRRVGGIKRELPVWPMEQVEKLENEIILGAVGSRGARNEIREFLLQTGKQEGQDFLFVT